MSYNNSWQTQAKSGYFDNSSSSSYQPENIFEQQITDPNNYGSSSNSIRIITISTNNGQAPPPPSVISQQQAARAQLVANGEVLNDQYVPVWNNNEINAVNPYLRSKYYKSTENLSRLTAHEQTSSLSNYVEDMILNSTEPIRTDQIQNIILNEPAQTEQDEQPQEEKHDEAIVEQPAEQNHEEHVDELKSQNDAQVFPEAQPEAKQVQQQEQPQAQAQAQSQMTQIRQETRTNQGQAQTSNYQNDLMRYYKMEGDPDQIVFNQTHQVINWTQVPMEVEYYPNYQDHNHSAIEMYNNSNKQLARQQNSTNLYPIPEYADPNTKLARINATKLNNSLASKVINIPGKVITVAPKLVIENLPGVANPVSQMFDQWFNPDQVLNVIYKEEAKKLKPNNALVQLNGRSQPLEYDIKDLIMNSHSRLNLNQDDKSSYYEKPVVTPEQIEEFYHKMKKIMSKITKYESYILKLQAHARHGTFPSEINKVKFPMFDRLKGDERLREYYSELIRKTQSEMLNLLIKAAYNQLEVLYKDLYYLRDIAEEYANYIDWSEDERNTNTAVVKANSHSHHHHHSHSQHRSYSAKKPSGSKKKVKNTVVSIYRIK